MRPQTSAVALSRTLLKGKQPAGTCWQCYLAKRSISKSGANGLGQLRLHGTASPSGPASLPLARGTFDPVTGGDSFRPSFASQPSATPIPPSPDEVSPSATSGSSATDTMPQLADLEALRPPRSHAIPIPKMDAPTSSADFGLYHRRWGRLVSAVARAFTKEQVIHLARNVCHLPDISSNGGKRAMIRRLVSHVFQLPDPEEWVAREKDRTSNVSKTPVTQLIPLSERDIYFLLGDPGRSDFLRFLSAKRRVKLSIVGTHDRKLKVEGPADRVEQIKIDWAAHQASIKTASIPDPAVPSLKKDLLRPLSLATGSLVQQHERKRTLNVTYREGEQHGLDRVRLLVERLARQEKIASSTPRIVAKPISDSEDETTFHNMPFLRTDAGPKPWYISHVPLFGLSRYSSTSGAIQSPVNFSLAPDSIASRLHEHLQPEAKNGSIRPECSLRLLFGHHVFVDPGASDPSLQAQSASQIEQFPGRSMFVPASPPGMDNLYHVKAARPGISLLRQQVAGLKIHNASLRRLVYRAQDVHEYMEFERLIPAAKELDSPDMSGTEWKGWKGRQSWFDLLLPSRRTDARIEALTRTDLPATADENDDLHALYSLGRSAAPSEVSHAGASYLLMSDKDVRRTTITGDVEAEWAKSCAGHIVLERCYEKLEKGVRTTGTVVEFADSRGFDAIEKLLACVRLV